jgi:hypothetical protein
MNRTLVFDIECMPNWFLVAFRNVGTGKVAMYETYEGHPLDVAMLRKILNTFKLVSFNGINYDIPVLSMAMTGASCEEIRKVSDAIIVGGKRYWEVARQFQFSVVEPNHIDIMEVAPGMGGLKLYGGRLNCQTLQDLPYGPDEMVTPEMREEMKAYCANDLDLTVGLYMKLLPQIELREKMTAQYGLDLRSKSDAQIAEAVIKSRVQEMTGKQLVRPEVKPWTRFNYITPDFISFQTRPLRETLHMVQESEFKIDNAGTLVMPDTMANALIPIGNSVYRMGIGGLHSTEASTAHHTDAENVLVDRDVASYYPSIILRCGFAPAHMGENFTKVYRGLVEERLAAKNSGNKLVADSLKIVINGGFGKLGSKWSILYSPELLIQVTVTGQLALLMLIELLEMNGIPVVSANTDGIVIKCPRIKSDELELIIEHWEIATGFTTEETRYAALYSRDVNSYLAIKTDGKVKQKGALAFTGTKGMEIEKNPSNYICIDAVIAFLASGVPIETTVRECRDISRFITVRTVKGGAMKADLYLGKVVRWYHAVGVMGGITYKTSGNLVPNSDGGMPIMTMPEDYLPDDIDYQWYINEAREILGDIGAIAPTIVKRKKAA